MGDGRSRRWGRLAVVAGALLAVTSAGCGGPEAPAAASFAAAPAPGSLLRILDPSGRLYLHSTGLRVAWFDAGGTLHNLPLDRGPNRGEDAPVYDASEVPTGAEVFVFAHGCRVARTHASVAGEAMVRLERGVPVRLRLRWDGRLPEGWDRLGIGLQGKPAPGTPAARANVTFHAIGSDWMDRDLPTKPDWTLVPGPDAEMVLYVPEAGSYDLHWKLDAPNRGSAIHDLKGLTVTDPPPDASIELVVPVDWLAQMDKQTDQLFRKAR